MFSGGIFTMSFFGLFKQGQKVSEPVKTSPLSDYRQVLAERTEEGVAVIGLDRKLQFVNGAWASMHGFDNKDGLIGKNISRFYSNKAANDVNRFIAQTKMLGWYISGIEQRRGDGSTFAGQLKMAALKDETGKLNGMLLILADLSGLARMQKVVEQTSRELETLKDRLKKLEEDAAARTTTKKVRREYGDSVPISANPPLPIGELKQLSEMARRFK